MDVKYLVYENWRAKKAATIHKANCSHKKDGLERILDKNLFNSPAENDRWFGEFQSLDDAAVFASLLPNRPAKYCKRCFKNEISKLIDLPALNTGLAKKPKSQ